MSSDTESTTSEVIVLSSNQKNEFKSLALKYFSFDEKIKELESEAKKLKKDRKETEEKILDFMENNSIDDFKTDKGKMEYSISERKVPLNKKILQVKLLEFFNSDLEKVQQLTTMLDDREKVTKVSLKIKKK
jgi:hypothetical protein